MYLLLTEFEVHTVIYGQGSITYSTDREDDLRTFVPQIFPYTDFSKLKLQVENHKFILKYKKKLGVTKLILKIRHITDHSISRVSSHWRCFWLDSLLLAYI